jgi:hypothetical protein
MPAWRRAGTPRSGIDEPVQVADVDAVWNEVDAVLADAQMLQDGGHDRLIGRR